MQYVRNISDSVSTAWNSINPSTLSGAIDVIVVEHADGSLACSPFHVRFGKFSLLRPYEKKVEFQVNGVKQSYAMKLAEGGEAFFVFQTSETIPESMQTSPLVSPASSPPLSPTGSTSQLDPDLLNLDMGTENNDDGIITPLSESPNLVPVRPASGDWSAALARPRSDDVLRSTARASEQLGEDFYDENSERSQSPPPLAPKEAMDRAIALSKGLSAVNIPSQVTETGDIMLDMSGFRSSEEEILNAELQARKILSEELDGNYDIGALFGFDEEGNLWIYSSERAKKEAMDKTIQSSLQSHRRNVAADAVSDPGYQSDGSDVTNSARIPTHRRSESDAGPPGLQTPPRTPTDSLTTGAPARNYAKSLRLTSDQLKSLELKPGENSMSFSVNRATCTANMYLWKHDTPVVISDIDGTVTKSDALGHVLNIIGRDWTHPGIAKLYSDIALNGYNIMYLTSRGVGQADTTRAYLNGIVQEGCRMPHGPTILSPDRTMAALRREVYLRKPHVFKMATLRDIANLYPADNGPFYAGFGNRLTDQISYRTVDVPRNRIFTINSNSEVSLDLLSLNKLKMSYVHINEVVDHYFPSVATLVKGGGEDYTDFKYWRDEPLELDEFSASEDEDDDEPIADDGSEYTDDEEDDDENNERLGDSYISHGSMDEGRNRMTDSMANSFEDDADEDVDGDLEDEDEGEDDDEYDERGGVEETAATMAAKLSTMANASEDINAELITGIGNLSMERKSS